MVSFSDSGFLFSGSRPASLYKESPSSGIQSSVCVPVSRIVWHFWFLFVSDYFSLKSGSRPSSPGPSPTPSVAGSVTSSSGSARRRPLISPARLNISGQKLRLFSSEPESPIMSPPVSPSYFLAEQSSIYSSCFSNNAAHFQSHNGKHGWNVNFIKRCSSCLSFVLLPLDGRVKHCPNLDTNA